MRPRFIEVTPLFWNNEEKQYQPGKYKKMVNIDHIREFMPHEFSGGTLLGITDAPLGADSLTQLVQESYSTIWERLCQ
jgi:hypothetical protein